MSELAPPTPGNHQFLAPTPELPVVAAAEVERTIYEPTVEELQKGYVLNPDGIIAFNIAPNRSAARQVYTAPNGITVEGRAVAEVRIGGTQTYATGFVINTFDAPDRQDYSFFVMSPNEAFAIPLRKGEMNSIGRRQPHQDRLPVTVSSDHCEVGLDDQGRFVIDNHNPTNMTAARRW